MLLSLGKNSLDSLLKEVRVVKEGKQQTKTPNGRRKLQMLLLPRNNGLDSLRIFEEVRVFIPLLATDHMQR